MFCRYTGLVRLSKTRGLAVNTIVSIYAVFIKLNLDIV
jgi:hypothetical protein